MKDKDKVLLEILSNDATKVASCLDFQELANKKILLTGANGLIGINFLTSLWQIGIKIPGITIIPIIHSEPPLYLLPIINSKNVQVLKGDLTNEGFLEKLPSADIIIHAAGSGEPSKFMINQFDSLKINSLTTFRLFEKLNENGRFLFISSSEIYNGLESPEYSENQIGITNTDNPRACYIEGKRTGETICNLYRKQGVNAFSVRLSLTYGPGVRLGDQRVLPSLIQKALKGKIDLLDSGHATRTFCYISDAIELMWYILLYGNSSCYNVGGISTIKIKELAYLIGKILNVPIVIPKEDTGIAGAPDSVYLNINRVLSEYNKERFIDLEEGITRTINWYKNLECIF
ncbi:MAG: NAD-dependent epimerase/dehydratase family protein [Chloroflexi bacterium]|nr:NAD-dependent epimerase/dehydratase family protein [Chloroflexota bacterium]